MAKYKLHRRYITNQERNLHNDAVNEFAHERTYVKNATFSGIFHFNALIPDKHTHVISMSSNNRKGEKTHTPAVAISTQELKFWVEKMIAQLDTIY